MRDSPHHCAFSMIWVLLVTNLLGFIAGYLVLRRIGARRARGKKR